jgi:hypothetical protein
MSSLDHGSSLSQYVHHEEQPTPLTVVNDYLILIEYPIELFELNTIFGKRFGFRIPRDLPGTATSRHSVWRGFSVYRLKYRVLAQEDLTSFSIGLAEVVADSPVYMEILGLPSNKVVTRNSARIELLGSRKAACGRGQHFGAHRVGEDWVKIAAPGGYVCVKSSQPFSESDSVTVEYETAVPAVWLIERILEPLAFFLNLLRGVCFIHASCFELAGRSVIVTGWTRIGKTQILLEALERGASLVSDDWVGISPAGILSYPRTIKLSAGNLQKRPEIAKKGFERGGSIFVTAQDLGYEVLDSSRIENVIMVHRTRGRGVKISEIDVPAVAEQLSAVLSYVLVHYLGSIYSAFAYAQSEAFMDLPCLVRGRARSILSSSLDCGDLTELEIGYGSDDEMFDAISSIAGVTEDA